MTKTAGRRKPFPFLKLPPELRVIILEFVLFVPYTIDLDPSNHKLILPLLQLFLTSRKMHEEAYPLFYGINAFRLLPVHGKFFGSKWPLTVWLPRRYRACIKTVELRLGPGWTAPPKNWAITRHLGLADMGMLKMIKVFVEIDPAAHESFRGFMPSNSFFTNFSTNLLVRLMEEVPHISQVQFDGDQSVAVNGPLMVALLARVADNVDHISFGPSSGWSTINSVPLSQSLIKSSV
jgi:hypothetical protein